MKIIATPEQLKVVDFQRQPLDRPNPLAEVVESLLQEKRHTFSKECVTIPFQTKKGIQNEQY